MTADGKQTYSDLAGLRILVVEDEFLLAEAVERALRNAGCDVVGPLPRLAKALAVAKTEALSGAVLDINLAGEEVYPAADALVARAIPIIFATGYARADIPARFRSIPRLVKPYAMDDLVQLAAQTFPPLRRAAQR